VRGRQKVLHDAGRPACGAPPTIGSIPGRSTPACAFIVATAKARPSTLGRPSGRAAAGTGVAVVPAPTECVTLPELVYRPLDDALSSVELMTISRPDELSGPVRAFLGRR
jgi:hypothetical protein